MGSIRRLVGRWESPLRALAIWLLALFGLLELFLERREFGFHLCDLGLEAGGVRRGLRANFRRLCWAVAAVGIVTVATAVGIVTVTAVPVPMVVVSVPAVPRVLREIDRNERLEQADNTALELAFCLCSQPPRRYGATVRHFP
mmetsp:Transcript_47931/g.108797  ORF Transcript_47931/g.108797 Transcript_47931/m.108797 type:complete len:143 (-) Transcript_47931:199-627(-)